MSSGIRLNPTLELFPLYRSGNVVRTPWEINEDSTFFTLGNDFVPRYAVNIAPTSSSTLENTFFTYNTDGLLKQKPLSALLGFDNLLQLSGTQIVSGSIPSSTPDIPEQFQDIVSYFDVTDDNFDALLLQPEFTIAGLGLGLTVTTDGMGGIDSVRLDPTARGLFQSPAAISEAFGGFNRTDLTLASTFKTLGPGFQLGGNNADEDNDILDETNGLQQADPANQNPLVNPFLLNQARENQPIPFVNSLINSRRVGSKLAGLFGFSLGNPPDAKPSSSALNNLALSNRAGQAFTFAQQVPGFEAGIVNQKTIPGYNTFLQEFSAFNQKSDRNPFSLVVSTEPSSEAMAMEKVMDGRVNVLPMPAEPYGITANALPDVQQPFNFGVETTIADAGSGSSGFEGFDNRFSQEMGGKQSGGFQQFEGRSFHNTSDEERLKEKAFDFSEQNETLSDEADDRRNRKQRKLNFGFFA
ncbi:MAG: hypothetical protein AAGI66_03790 [Cyanobacteria bacterium P01_H01_bin.74]